MRAQLEAERDPGIEFVDVFVNNTASPDYSKNGVTAEIFDEKRMALTDVNRNGIMSQIEDSAADYIYWFDDDTAHPPGALRQLLDLKVPFAAGLYYLKNPPYVPVAYFINPNGTYRSLLQFKLGELIEVDFTGMGCALIHRDVYKAIRAAHTVYKTTRGSYVVVQNKNIHQEAPRDDLAEESVYGDRYIEKVRPVDEEEMISSQLYFPYYGMEVTRTEDIWFCQLAEHVGFKPLIDTSINCGHYGELPITRANFKKYGFVPKEDGDEPEKKQG